MLQPKKLCFLLSNIVIIFVIAFVTENVAARELNDAEKVVIANAVKEELKDPVSATFKWLDYRGQNIYCSYVNAKNSFGGYVGNVMFQVFIVELDNQVKIAAVLGLATGDPNSSRSLATAQICRDKGYP